MPKPSVFDVTIERPGGVNTPQGTGMERTPTGGYRAKPGTGPSPVTAPLDAPDAAAAGKPIVYRARYFRKPAAFQAGWRDEGEQGVSTKVDRQVLSLLPPDDGTPIDVREGDIVTLPIGTIYGDRTCRARLLLPRLYPSGVQCDIETDNV